MKKENCLTTKYCVINNVQLVIKIYSLSSRRSFWVQQSLKAVLLAFGLVAVIRSRHSVSRPTHAWYKMVSYIIIGNLSETPTLAVLTEPEGNPNTCAMQVPSALSEWYEGWFCLRLALTHLFKGGIGYHPDTTPLTEIQSIDGEKLQVLSMQI